MMDCCKNLSTDWVESVWVRVDGQLVCRAHEGHPLWVDSRYEIGDAPSPAGSPPVPSVDHCDCGDPLAFTGVDETGWLFICPQGHRRSFTNWEMEGA